jgi:uracil-DNA glycosylase
MIVSGKEQIVKVNYNLDVDYSLLLHKSWLPILNPILNSKYMRDMMVLLHESYKIQYVTPAKKNIFKAFELTDAEALRVVIIGKEPYLNSNATGLAYANPDHQLKLSPEIKAIAECVQKTMHNGFNIDFDYTLECWADQGVLLLNSAMTNFEGDIDQLTVWRNFIRETVTAIDDENVDIHFVLLGEDAHYFERYINTAFNFVYCEESPEEAIALNRVWDSSVFQEINRKIERVEGPHGVIEW